jgi:hypothetical protein
MLTLGVGFVLETLAAQEGLSVIAENIDDVCFGMVIPSDKTFLQVAREASSVYNYQIVDGDPIRLVRRAVNDDLVIDFEINEVDCIRRGEAPAVGFSRRDPAALPRQVEIQYIDPDRDFAISTQVARHTAAPTTNTQISVAIDFVISAQQARNMAFDLLYRIWSQQLLLAFETPDLTIEPGDTFRLTCTQGVFTCIVISQTINMPARTNSIRATILLTTKATTDIVDAPDADPFTVTAIALLTEDSTSSPAVDVEVLTEDDILIITEG